MRKTTSPLNDRLKVLAARLPSRLISNAGWKKSLNNKTELTKLEASMKSRISLLLLILALAASSTLTAHASGCTNMTIKGTWVNSLHGQIFLPDGTSLVLTGVTKTTYDGLGNSTQLDASGVNGNVPTGWRTGSGSYTVNPDCTGTETISFPGQPDIHAQFVVAQSGNKLHFVNVDPGIALSGEVERLNAPEYELGH